MVSVLPVVLLFMLAAGAPSGALAEGLPPLDRSPEVGGPATPDDPVLTIPPIEIHTRLEASLSGFVFTDDGMADDYTGLIMGQGGVTMEIGPHTQYLLAVGYGRATATLPLDTPGFDSDPEIRLTLLPVRMGLRVNTSGDPRFQVNLGAFFQAVWMRESVPYYETFPVFAAGFREGDGWGRQAGFTIGPEWRLNRGKFAMGFELAGAIGGGSVGEYNERDVGLDGFSGRMYGSVRIGAGPAGDPAQEVQP